MKAYRALVLAWRVDRNKDRLSTMLAGRISPSDMLTVSISVCGHELAQLGRHFDLLVRNMSDLDNVSPKLANGEGLGQTLKYVSA